MLGENRRAVQQASRILDRGEEDCFLRALLALSSSISGGGLVVGQSFHHIWAAFHSMVSR